MKKYTVYTHYEPLMRRTADGRPTLIDLGQPKCPEGWPFPCKRMCRECLSTVRLDEDSMRTRQCGRVQHHLRKWKEAKWQASFACKALKAAKVAVVTLVMLILSISFVFAGAFLYREISDRVDENWASTLGLTVEEFRNSEWIWRNNHYAWIIQSQERIGDVILDPITNKPIMSVYSLADEPVVFHHWPRTRVVRLDNRAFK